MATAELSEVQLFFTDEGAGTPPILFVHGWSCDSHDWSAQIDAFASGHRVIAVDLRGHGRSSVTDGGYAPTRLAADLAELLERLGTEPVVAVGHSLGGAVVSTLAVEHPEWVRAVVAVDPAYGMAEGMIDPAPVFDLLRSPDGREQVIGLFDTMDKPTTPPALRAWHRRRFLGTSGAVLAGALEGLVGGDRSLTKRPTAAEYFARRTVPVFTIYADPERAAWEATTFEHPYSRAVSWAGAGHWLHQERPEEFNALVLAWVDGLPA